VGVHCADDHPGALGQAGSAVPLGHEPGQARTGRAGRAHQRPGLAPRLVSGHRRPSGRVYVHPALPDRPTAPGMTPRSGRFRVRPTRQDQPHHQGPPPSSLAVHARDLPATALQVTAPRHTCRLEILSSLRLPVPGGSGNQSDARLSYIRLPGDLVEVGHADPRRRHPAAVQGERNDANLQTAGPRWLVSFGKSHAQ
jgi:hypothetical protein